MVRAWGGGGLQSGRVRVMWEGQYGVGRGFTEPPSIFLRISPVSFILSVFDAMNSPVYYTVHCTSRRGRNIQAADNCLKKKPKTTL